MMDGGTRPEDLLDGQLQWFELYSSLRSTSRHNHLAFWMSALAIKISKAKSGYERRVRRSHLAAIFIWHSSSICRSILRAVLLSVVRAAILVVRDDTRNT